MENRVSSRINNLPDCCTASCRKSAGAIKILCCAGAASGHTESWYDRTRRPGSAARKARHHRAGRRLLLWCARSEASMQNSDSSADLDALLKRHDDELLK